MFGFGKKAQPPQAALVLPGYEGWNVLGSSFNYGAGTLKPDGDATLQGILLRQDFISRVSPLAIADSALRWAPGPEGELELLAPDATHVFKFFPQRRVWLGQRRPVAADLRTIISRAWEPHGPTGELGPLKFHENGDIEIPDGRRLDQSVAIEHCTMGDALLNKKAGVGEEFLAQTPSVTHALVYMSRCWFYQQRPS